MDLKVSLPNKVSDEAQRLADELEISLDQLFALALSHYLSLYQGEHVTNTLDTLYETESSTLDPGWRQRQAATLDDERW